MNRYLIRAPFMAMALLAGGASAERYSVLSVTTPAFGTLVSGFTGTTTFLNNGIVSKQSGNGSVYAGPVVRSVVTIRCTNGKGGNCVDGVALVKIFATGVNTGRAQTISQFTAVGGTATIGSGTSSGAGPLLFQIPNWVASNSDRSFFLDITLPITGDDVGGATGAATSQFTVLAGDDPVTPTLGITLDATATVRRAMHVTEISSLSFGTLVRAGSGSGTVAIDATTGARTTGGANPPIIVSGPTFSNGNYTLIGEPGTAFTITISAPTTLASGANTVPLTLTSTISGSQTMPVGGSLALGVGASATVSGTQVSATYSATYSVTITYN